MSSIVSEERSKLHNEYARLRTSILHYYLTLALVGAAPGAAEHKLPPKLGHWTLRHSAMVGAVSQDLIPIVLRIETLRAWRDPTRIKSQRAPQNRGHNFRRNNARRTKVQLNPGEWPPRYK
jgi:hypothetical protein